jgi:RecA-family ATPase
MPVVDSSVIAEQEELQDPDLVVAETSETEIRCIARRHEEFFPVRTLGDVFANPATAPPWVIKDLLLKDSATLVSAHPHSMKSLSLLSACMEAVATKQVWKHFPAPNVTRSLFIETEDPQWMVEDRIRGLARGLGLDRDLPGFLYSCVHAFDLVQKQDEIFRLLALHKPDFIVLSTLQSLLGGRDWTRQDQMADVNALVVRVSRICPLIVVTHSPWNKKAKRAAGTITQTANYMTAAHYQKTDNLVHIDIDSKAGAQDANFTLQLETEGDEVRGFRYANKGWAKGQKYGAVKEAIESDTGESNKEIAERIGCDVRYVQKIRKKLAEQDKE